MNSILGELIVRVSCEETTGPVLGKVLNSYFIIKYQVYSPQDSLSQQRYINIYPVYIAYEL